MRSSGPPERTACCDHLRMDGEARLAAAVRDIAVHVASQQRAPWRISWFEAADLFELRLGAPHVEADGGGWVSCEWAVPSEGTSGGFDAGFERLDGLALAVAEQFVERVGDLAAESWRQPRPWPS